MSAHREVIEHHTQEALAAVRKAIRSTPRHGPNQKPTEASARWYLEQAERNLKRALSVWYSDLDPSDDG
jgi:hypothetical protein